MAARGLARFPPWKARCVKKIPLSKGKFALVDNKDYAFLTQWKWHYISPGYAARNSKMVDGVRPSKILMHREINKTETGMDTDHEDNNGLNNQRFNLRDSTRTQNNTNSAKRKNKTSKFKGVCFCKRSKKWKSRIQTVNGNINLGDFKNEKLAAKAYDAAAEKYFGKFARHNGVK